MKEYQIESAIGAGAEGTVYRAFDGEKWVALKLRPDPSPEGQFLRQVSCSGVPLVYDHGELEYQGVNYFAIAMELVPGMAVDVWRTMMTPTDEECRLIFEQLVEIATCLDHASIVHRDIKPANLMIDTNMNLTLIDFGSACNRGSCTGWIGTPQFASPELLLNRTQPEDDIWSIGMTMYYIITGTYPTKNMGVREIQLWIRTGAPIRTIPGWEILNSMIRVDVNRRVGLDGMNQFLHPSNLDSTLELLDE